MTASSFFLHVFKNRMHKPDINIVVGEQPAEFIYFPSGKLFEISTSLD